MFSCLNFYLSDIWHLMLSKSIQLDTDQSNRFVQTLTDQVHFPSIWSNNVWEE